LENSFGERSQWSKFRTDSIPIVHHFVDHWWDCERIVVKFGGNDWIL
jgi:hypothetical protein